MNGPVLGISSRCGFSPILSSAIDICGSVRSGAEPIFTGLKGSKLEGGRNSSDNAPLTGGMVVVVVVVVWSPSLEKARINLYANRHQKIQNERHCTCEL